MALTVLSTLINHTSMNESNSDPICKNPEQSRIFENSDFCIMVFCISKAFFCSSIKSVIQIGLVLQG